MTSTMALMVQCIQSVQGSGFRFRGRPVMPIGEAAVCRRFGRSVGASLHRGALGVHATIRASDRFSGSRGASPRRRAPPASRAARASAAAATRWGRRTAPSRDSGCVSMNTPATPAATAARASTGTNSRWPPRRRALPARQLHRMRGVEHDRAAGGAHDRERAHVGHEVVIAERRAALAHQDVVGAARRLRLGDDLPHVLGRQELALLDVDRLARRAPPPG